MTYTPRNLNHRIIIDGGDPTNHKTGGGATTRNRKKKTIITIYIDVDMERYNHFIYRNIHSPISFIVKFIIQWTAKNALY